MAGESQGQQQGSSSTGNEGGGSAAASGGASGDVDFSAVIQHQNQQLERQQRDIMSMRGTNEKNAAVLSRMKQVFAPEDDKKPKSNRKEQWAQQLDQYLQAGLEAERAGKPIPLTANLAAQFFQTQMENEDEKANMLEKIQRLEALAARANDPGVQIDNVAFSHIDSMVENAMNTIYGQGEDYQEQKGFQYDAITAQIANEVKYLKDKEPEVWNRIRRNPGDRQKLVNYYVEKNMPPKARQILEREKLQNTPMKAEDYVQAFREAKNIEDPRQAARMRESIRQEFLSDQLYARKGRGMLSRMYNGK